jgi:hypothetical protein
MKDGDPMKEPRPEQPRGPRPSPFKEYVLGLVVGPVCALYGLVALWTRATFLPGLKGGDGHFVTGGQGAALAAAYVAGGLYLLARFFIHHRCRTEPMKARLYTAENLLLVALIAAMAFVLWSVGHVT